MVLVVFRAVEAVLFGVSSGCDFSTTFLVTMRASVRPRFVEATCLRAGGCPKCDVPNSVQGSYPQGFSMARVFGSNFLPHLKIEFAGEARPVIFYSRRAVLPSPPWALASVTNAPRDFRLLDEFMAAARAGR